MMQVQACGQKVDTMEVEAKFAIPDRNELLRLQRVVRLGPFVPGDTEVVEVCDVYLDTEDYSLYRNGYACRIRRYPAGGTLSVKGLGEVVEAVHRRTELEESLPQEASTDLQSWPKGEARTLVESLVGGAALRQLFSVEQVRHVRPLYLRGRMVAALSLDEVRIVADGREQACLCLEAELTEEGQESDLEALSLHLVKTWGLVAEQCSKFGLGLRLVGADTELELGGSDDLGRVEGEPGENQLLLEPEADGDAEVENIRIAREERMQLEQIVTEGASGRDRRHAALILGWGRRLSVRQLSQEIGFSQSWAYELIARFKAERLEMFSSEPISEPLEQGSSDTVDGAKHTLIEEPLESVLSVDEQATGVSTTSVGELVERFQIDTPHADYVTEVALRLFDSTEAIHHLGAERRRLLVAAGMLHDVGLDVDPDRHHGAGRDIILGSRLDGFSDVEQRMLAAAVYLHRKRVRRRKLERGVVASLPLVSRRDALILAALVRVADGLDYSRSQSTCLEGVRIRSSSVLAGVTGPRAQADAARAQAKADLWETLFAETPFFFAAFGEGQVTEEMEAGQGVGLEFDLAAMLSAKSPGVAPDDLMSEAGRKVLAFHLARMLAHEPGTRAGTDIEELHDMRVATRRMRAALRVFGSYYKARTVRPYAAGLRRTARALGQVRDLDVFIERAHAYLGEIGPERGDELDVLLEAWSRQREQARKSMMRVLDSPKYEEFVESLRLFVLTSGVGARAMTGMPPRPGLVRHAVPRLVYDRWSRVQAFGPLLEGAQVTVLHALRIECKRLRYTLEFFSDVLSPQAKSVIQAVVRLQDHLGDLNDADVANTMLSDFLFARRSRGEVERLIAPGVVAYLASRQRDLGGLIDAFPDAWETFNQPQNRRALADAVAVL